MIIDPQSFVPLEVSRRLAVAEAAYERSQRTSPASRRRGLTLRLVSMVIGRTAHV